MRPGVDSGWALLRGLGEAVMVTEGDGECAGLTVVEGEKDALASGLGDKDVSGPLFLTRIKYQAPPIITTTITIKTVSLFIFLILSFSIIPKAPTFAKWGLLQLLLLSEDTRSYCRG